MRRDWTKARAKVDSEAECRVCERGDGLQAAHVIGRKYDPPTGKVDPLDIVPLCVECHMAYDAHRLDLLPYLTYPEQGQAASHVGLVRALKRTSPETEWVS